MSAKDEAHPDRIWAYDDGAHIMAFDWPNSAGGAVEYIRSDLARTEASAEAFASAAVSKLLADACAEADRAMRKFPQPNYVISKVAEEAGEVVRAAIHCAEGRETPENVVSEIRQVMAMLIRLYVEGDQVHGLASLEAIKVKP